MRNFRNPIYLWIFTFTALRLVLNGILKFDHTGDGWGYACDLLKHDFKNGHHLLFQYFQYSHWKIFIGLGGDKIYCIQWFTAVNIVLGSCILLVSKWILDSFLTTEEKKKHAIWMIAFISVGMGFNRYSFENETYTLPLLLELIAILYFQKLMLRATLKNTLIIYAATFLAPLFHQTAIWGSIAVWLGLWIHRDSFHWQKPKQKILGGILFIGVLWTIIYWVFARFIYHISIKELVFQDVINGSVETSWDLKTVGFTLVNFIRTFIEFKGSTILLLKSQPIAWIVLLFFIIGISVASFSILKSGIALKMKIRINSIPLFQVLLYALCFHMLFSIFSQGNHEFMMPIGVLLPLLLAFNLKHSPIFKPSMVLALAFWNAYFFYFANFQNGLLIQTTDKYTCLKTSYFRNHIEKSKLVFISNEASRIYNYADYLYLTHPLNNLYANSRNSVNNLFYRDIAIKFPETNSSETNLKNSKVYWADFDNINSVKNRASFTYRPEKLGKKKKTVVGAIKKDLEQYQISVID